VPPANQPHCRRSARRATAVVHGQDIGAAVCIGESDRDRHLAAQCRICRLELDDFESRIVLSSATSPSRYGSPAGGTRPAVALFAADGTDGRVQPVVRRPSRSYVTRVRPPS
jgi:hypothetical protein